MNIKDTISSLNKKEFSCEELISNCFKKIKDDKLNDFITLFEDEAISKAREIDKNIKSGKKLKSLEGIPIAIKDNILISGKKTTAGSKMLENYIAPYNAMVIEKLKKTGTIFIGKTNMDEFAMGSSNETSYFGPVLNPYDKKRVPGGSSGGSAVSVAAKHSILALGSDTSGSIRQPASFCGVVGLKPSYSRVSRYGLISLASSLDQIGPFANCVEDVAILFNSIIGEDEHDATSNKSEPVDLENIKKSIKNKKIGVIKDYKKMLLDNEVKDAFENTIRSLEQMGAKIEEIDMSFIEDALFVYYIIQPAESSSNLARYDGFRYGKTKNGNFDLDQNYFANRTDGFGDEVKRRIMMGTYVLSSGYKDAYYNKARAIQNDIKLRFKMIFSKVSCVLTPTTPTRAFKLNEIKDPLKMYYSDLFTVSANIAGIPAISLPIAKNPLPIGIQVLGDYMKEETILNIAHNIELIYNKKNA